MPYTPQTWVDNQSPLTAARMNVIESGIVAAQTQMGFKVPTPASTTVASTAGATFTVPAITVPTNARLFCEAKIHATASNGNQQTLGWGNAWTVTAGSTVARSTYEHQRAFTTAGDYMEFDLWSRGLIDTGSNTSIVVTITWATGSGNNGFTLDTPEFFYMIGVAAP